MEEIKQPLKKSQFLRNSYRDVSALLKCYEQSDDTVAEYKSGKKDEPIKPDPLITNKKVISLSETKKIEEPLKELKCVFNYINNADIKALKNLKTRQPGIFNFKDHEGNNALHHAVASDFILKFLLIETSSRYLIDERNNEGNTPLHNAAKLANSITIGLLLEFDADAEIKNNKQQTPVDILLANNKPDLAKFIKEASNFFNGEKIPETPILQSSEDDLVIRYSSEEQVQVSCAISSNKFL